MADLQRSREMALWLKEKGGRLGEGEWSRIVEVVHDQAYSRVVGPYSNELEVSARTSIRNVQEVVCQGFRV